MTEVLSSLVVLTGANVCTLDDMPVFFVLYTGWFKMGQNKVDRTVICDYYYELI